MRMNVRWIAPAALVAAVALTGCTRKNGELNYTIDRGYTKDPLAYPLQLDMHEKPTPFAAASTPVRPAIVIITPEEAAKPPAAAK